MLKAGVGCSLQELSGSAARDAAEQAMKSAGLGSADWALVFSTFPHMEDDFSPILKAVSGVTGTADVVGSSALGVLTGLGEIEAEPAVAVLAVSSDSVTAVPFIVDSTGDGGLTAGGRIGELFQGAVPKERFLTVLPDPFNVHPELLFKGIESKMGEIDIVGASSSLHPGLQQTYQFMGSDVRTGAVSGFMLEGAFKYRIGVTQGCQPVGIPMTVTHAQDNIIFELDGKPAVTAMMEQVPARILNERSHLFYLVFAAFSPDPEDKEIVDGEYLVRNIMGMNEGTGILAVAENVHEGQVLQFTVRHPTLAREDLKQMLGRVKGDNSGGGSEGDFKFGLYFSCCARGSSLYGHKGIDTAYITEALGDVPLIGFFGNSEFAPLRGVNRLFTYTGVLVLVSE